MENDMPAPRGAEVWRDYVTDGVPSSGRNDPAKADARAWSTWLENLVTSGVLSSGPWFATKEAMTLGYAANTIAVVYDDTTAAENGLYIKVGASGSGSWSQITTFLPGYQFITASPTGASTANVIVATTSPRLPAGNGVALVTLPVPHTNTAAAVTVAFDGDAALTIKTRSGEDPAIGELQEGDVLAGFVSGSTFRLITDPNSLIHMQGAKEWANNDEDDPVSAAAGGDGVTTYSAKHWAAKSKEDADRADTEADRSEVARAGAESARDQAAGYVNDIVAEKEVPITGTRNGMESIEFPAGMIAVETRGFGAVGDGGGALYIRVNAEPDVPAAAKVRSQDRWTADGDDDSVNGGWWVLDEKVVTDSMFGNIGDGLIDDTSAISAGIAFAFARGLEFVLEKPTYITKIVQADGSGAVTCLPEGVFKPHATADQSDIYDSDLLEFGAAVAGSEFDIRIDMHGMSKSGMRLRGSGNTVTSFRAKNIQGATGRTRNIWGVAISGNNNTVKYARTDDCKNTPSAMVGCATVAVDAYGEDNIIVWTEAYGGASAYLGNGKRNRIGTTIIDGTDDNGIYVIAGSEEYEHGTLIANRCSDEVAVFSGDKQSFVHRISARNCGRGVGIQNTDTLRIGSIDWFVDDPAVNSGSPLYIRNSNAQQINSLEIDEIDIRGIWRSGAPIWTLDDPDGQITSLSIGRLRARLIYDDATGVVTKNLAYSGSLIEQLTIGELDIEVIDGLGTLTAADVFRFYLPPDLTRASSIGRITLSTGGGAHQLRVLNFDQNVLTIGGVPTIRGDLNPPFVTNYATQVTRIFGSGAAPTQGTWRRGDMVWQQNPSAGGYVGWACVASGTPGTWKGFGAISA